VQRCNINVDNILIIISITKLWSNLKVNRSKVIGTAKSIVAIRSEKDFDDRITRVDHKSNLDCFIFD